ncbi:hypothetical protein HD554DRAFT_1309804 [Boletus coccyginus]|nr:hypothetical protein HD554DRAFT_1309804 [Boletus coccyginus]
MSFCRVYCSRLVLSCLVSDKVMCLAELCIRFFLVYVLHRVTLHALLISVSDLPQQPSLLCRNTTSLSRHPSRNARNNVHR